MAEHRWWRLSIGLILAGSVAAGCATSAEAPAEERERTLSDCISGEGQRFLTYCASPDAARQARRQQAIQQAADGETGPQDMVPLPVEGAPVFGAPDAAMTIHLFSDLRCSGCPEIYTRLIAEVEKYPEDTRLVFRHIPTDETSEVLARGAVAAAEQGKFWEFLAEVYSVDFNGEINELPVVAASAGLDVETWQRDRERERIQAILARDNLLADEVDVVGAPTFFINGRRMVGALSAQEIEEFVEGERTDIESMAAAGLQGIEISWRRILQNYQPVHWERIEEREEELQEGLVVEYVPVGSSPQKGAAPEQSLVTVVVFADFECPFCSEAAVVWNELVERYGSAGLRLVFKHFPLPIYDNSERIAAAAKLAEEVGAFWEFHDILFARQQEIDLEELQPLLERLGWSGEFEAEMARAIAEVREDRELGHQVGVEGTPTLFINGVQLMGVWSVEELTPLIEDQLELGATLMELTGNGGEELYRDLVGINGE